MTFAENVSQSLRPGGITWLDEHALPASGCLTVAEYNNMGDLNPSAPQEPAAVVQRIEAGKVSAPLTENTRMITLFASRQGEFAVFHFDSTWKDGDPVPASAQWVPIAETYEITRITHMTADLRVAFR